MSRIDELRNEFTQRAEQRKNMKDLLLPGYVVKFRNGTVGMIMQAGSNTPIIVTNTDGPVAKWSYLNSNYDIDLTHRGSHVTHWFGISSAPDPEKDIIAVYGLIYTSLAYNCALLVSTDYRPLLWERDAVKEMTIAEIEKELGYKVKIVK